MRNRWARHRNGRPEGAEANQPDPMHNAPHKLRNFDLPQPHRGIVAAAGQQPAIRTEGHTPDSAPMALQAPQLTAAVGLPQSHRVIQTAASHDHAVGTPRHGGLK